MNCPHCKTKDSVTFKRMSIVQSGESEILPGYWSCYACGYHEYPEQVKKKVATR